jgi:hypothetical protein
MKSAHKVRLLVAAALLGAGFAVSSGAATISLVPSTQTIAPGNATNVDIVLSGLAPTETVGAFSFLLSFNNAILLGNSFTIDPGGIFGPGALDLSGGFVPVGGSPLDVVFAADVLIDEPTLNGAEGTGFTLATVNFTGLAEGLSPLTLAAAPSLGVFLSNFAGTGEIPASAVNGSICVDSPNGRISPCVGSVPEPATLILSALGAGVAALVGRRRRELQPQA